MENNQLNNPDLSLNSQSEDNKYFTQLRIVKEYLKLHEASRFMVAVRTGIPIQNVCRYVDTLFNSLSIAVIRIDKCEISGQMVEFLSTDESKFPKSLQLELF